MSGCPAPAISAHLQLVVEHDKGLLVMPLLMGYWPDHLDPAHRSIFTNMTEMMDQALERGAAAGARPLEQPGADPPVAPGFPVADIIKHSMGLLSGLFHIHHPVVSTRFTACLLSQLGRVVVTGPSGWA
jgi:hypothetical protein